jgi:hypothetical protein
MLVEVIDVGETYDGYYDMAKRLSNGHYKENFIKYKLPKKGRLYKFTDSFTDNNFMKEYCYIIDIETNQGYVIGRKGIKEVVGEFITEEEWMI